MSVESGSQGEGRSKDLVIQRTVVLPISFKSYVLQSSNFPIASCNDNSVLFKFLVFLEELLSLWLLIVTASTFGLS